MYRVVEMYGDFEPWWFLDGWENDIIQEQRFEKYYDALKFYKIQWLKLETEFKEYKSRSDLMTVFWNEKDQRWCEECDDYVQQYRSIILLEDEKVIPKSNTVRVMLNKTGLRSIDHAESNKIKKKTDKFNRFFCCVYE